MTLPLQAIKELCEGFRGRFFCDDHADLMYVAAVCDAGTCDCSPSYDRDGKQDCSVAIADGRDTPTMEAVTQMLTAVPALVAEVERLTAEVANYRDFIQASEDVAKARDVLWYADENERMRAAFQKFAEAATANNPIAFSLSGCEWCHKLWPKPEGSTLEQIDERARRHVYSCKAHPMRIERDAAIDERDAYRSALADLVAATHDNTDTQAATYYRGKARDLLKNGPALPPAVEGEEK